MQFNLTRADKALSAPSLKVKNNDRSPGEAEVRYEAFRKGVLRLIGFKVKLT